MAAKPTEGSGRFGKMIAWELWITLDPSAPKRGHLPVPERISDAPPKLMRLLFEL